VKEIEQASVDELNIIRKEVGLPPIVKKTRKCMMCGKPMTSFFRKAWCDTCKNNLIESEVIGEEV
jgi:hypothetical protein